MFIATLVILGCTIAVFFSQEFVAGFKKIFAIPGMKLLLPITLATMLIVYYEAWVLWSLLGAKNTLNSSATVLASSLPFQQHADLIANILLLLILPVLPLVARVLSSKKKPIHDLRPYYVTIGILWFLVLALLIVDVKA